MPKVPERPPSLGERLNQARRGKPVYNYTAQEKVNSRYWRQKKNKTKLVDRSIISEDIARQKFYQRIQLED